MTLDQPVAIIILTLVVTAASSSELAVIQAEDERCNSKNARVCSIVDAACDVVHGSDGTSSDVCRWSSKTSAAGCEDTVGIWTTADSKFARNHPDAVVSGSAGACITEVKNIADKVIAGLRAGNSKGSKDPKAEEEKAASKSELAIPTNLTVGDISRTTLILSWVDNSDREYGVEMYRMNPDEARLNASKGWKFIGLSEERIDSRVKGSGMRSEEDYDLTPGTRYCYRLRTFYGFDRALVSDFSESVCTKTRP